MEEPNECANGANPTMSYPILSFRPLGKNVDFNLDLGRSMWCPEKPNLTYLILL